MNKIIDSILSNQGLSLAKLSHIIGGDMQYAKNRLDNLKSKQIKKLLTLYNLPSSTVRPKENALVKFNNKTYIDIYNILPSRRNGLNIYCKKIRNKLKVWYQPKSRGSIELLLPAYVLLDNNFITCFGLSIGDGLNNPSISNTHYNFVNTNLNLVKNIYDWLIRYFKLNKNKIQIYLLAPKDSNFIRERYIASKILSVNKNKIKVYCNDRSNKPEIMLQTSNAIFQCMYLKLFDRLNRIILYNKQYRRAFLNGLFAAEGHVKHSVYNTIESMGFAFNPKNELDLALFIKRCLAKEGIKCKINNYGYLYFCNYNQMLKSYIIGLLDLNKEKKDKFIRLCKNAKVYLHFKGKHIIPFNKFSQYELAKKYGMNQATMSNYKTKNIISFRLATILLNRKSLIDKVNFITISTNTINDKESIKFMINNLYNAENL